MDEELYKLWMYLFNPARFDLNVVCKRVACTMHRIWTRLRLALLCCGISTVHIVNFVIPFRLTGERIWRLDVVSFDDTGKCDLYQPTGKRGTRPPASTILSTPNYLCEYSFNRTISFKRVDDGVRNVAKLSESGIPHIGLYKMIAILSILKFIFPHEYC